MSILSSIMSMVTPVIVDRVAAALGINSTLARTAINLALPAILGAFAKKAATPAGAGDLFRAVSSADTGLFNNLDSMLGGAGKDQLINSGTSTLNNLLGSGAVNGLANMIGSKAGLGGGAASMLLPLVGQMALSGLAKSSAGKDAAGLASALAQEAGSFGGMDAPRTPSAPVAAAQAQGMNFLRWLIPLVALAAVLWYFLGSGGQAPQTTTEQPAQQGSTAAPAIVVDGVDVGKTLTDGFGTLTTTLGGVTDAATAQAALPKVQEVVASVDKAAAVAGKFSPEQKTAIGALITAGLPAVKAVAEKALAAQGVGDVLKPVVDGLFAKIEGMAK